MACHKEDMKQCYLRESVEIALLDLNFSFTQTQIKLAIEAWNMGMSIEEMAKLVRPFDRKGDAIDETAILIMHLKRRGKIKSRKGGILGN